MVPVRGNVNVDYQGQKYYQTRHHVEGVTGEEFSDSQSTNSDTSSDDNSSQDSVSSLSSASSAPCEVGTAVNGCISEHTFGTTIAQLDKSQVGATVPSWLDTVNDGPCSKTIPIEQRQNPRRSSQISGSNGEARPPPTLTRQSERKDCFVAILVGFAAQLVEAIWPLAACTPRTDTCFFGRGVLPLRTFITETLRRSRTSYSTLQVALFYLVLIKDLVPKTNFCTEQPRNGEEFRSMQCGRRMFLTALILASKYLQDRNYSTRAWSKISGLRTQEIHVNELNYCKVIGWNLHIPQEKFQRWSRIVLTLSRPIGPNSDIIAQRIGWPVVLSKLDINLSEDFEGLAGLPKTCSLGNLPLSANFSFGDNPSEKQGLEQFQGIYGSGTASSESPSDSVRPLSAPTPAVATQPPLPRIRNLPTPQSTPQSNHFGNFSGAYGTPAMSAAMAQTRNNCLLRATLDVCPPPQACLLPRPEEKARSCLSRSTTITSSPSESVISEAPTVYSRASRSSSVSSMASSVSVSSLPPKLDRLAVQRAAGVCESRNDAALFKQILEPRYSSSTTALGVLSSSPEFVGDTTGTASEVDSTTVNTANLNKDFRLQELEVAAALCKLRPMAMTSAQQHIQHQRRCDGKEFLQERPSPAGSRQSSRDNTPNAAYLNSLGDATPVPPPHVTFHGSHKGNSSISQSCHKRSHSKLADPLQDQVRSQLRMEASIPDRTVQKLVSSPQEMTIQSPTLTFGVSKTVSPVKGSHGQKRHCGYMATASDLATHMLRKDLVRPIR